MINIEEKIKEIKEKISDYTISFGNYDDTYIDDAINEIAKNQVDVYWSGLYKWLNKPGAEEYVEQAVREGLVDTKNFSLFNALMAGQSIEISDTLYKEREEGLYLYALIYMRKKLELKEITKEEHEELVNEDWNYDKFDEVKERVKEILKMENGNECND